MSDERVCRTCLRGDNLAPIFTKPEQRERYKVALFLTTGLQVEFEDGLPQTICKECRELIKVAIDFRTQCHRSEQTLLQLGFIRTNAKTSRDSKMKDYYLWCKQNMEPSTNNETQPNVKPEASGTEVKIERDGSSQDNPELRRSEMKSEPDDTEVPIELGDSFASYADHLDYSKNDSLEDSDGNTKRSGEKSSRCWSEDSFEMETQVRAMPRERKRAPHLDREKTYGHLVDKPMGLPGPYKCKACKKTLKNWSCFRSHAKVHAGFQFMCELCGKMYSTVTMLKRHCMSQHGAKCTYRCRFCDYGTWDTERLKIHERREHTKERPYVCDACGAGFYDRSNIIHHMVVHLVEKNVQCPQCPSKFKNRQQLMSHSWHVHRKQRATCDICHKSYTSSGNLREHQRKIHGVYQKGQKQRAPQKKRKTEPATQGDDGLSPSKRRSRQAAPAQYATDVQVTAAAGAPEWQYVQGPYGLMHGLLPHH